MAVSSEQRVKKLRGSGGYVVATVDDDQQRKGNLGGPDLFLAPIGRLNPESISKYFCNTCEKDYESSPRIDYENPNEEVAENLVLAERGQYVCSTCGSTIAEYREFKKPDEAADVGLARPVSPEPAGMGEIPATEPTGMAEIPTTEPTGMAEIPATEPSMAEIPAEPAWTPPQEVSPEPQEASSGPQGECLPPQVSSIVGMSVFDGNGIKVGTAKQVGVDATQSLVLVVSCTSGDCAIPWGRIKKVGEIILLNPDVAAGAQADAPAGVPAGACAGCGFENKPDAKFCEQCGSGL